MTSERWRKPAHIPNIEGTWVACLLKDGFWCLDVVTKDASGLHRLASTPITNVVGWKPWKSSR